MLHQIRVRFVVAGQTLTPAGQGQAVVPCLGRQGVYVGPQDVCRNCVAALQHVLLLLLNVCVWLYATGPLPCAATELAVVVKPFLLWTQLPPAFYYLCG